MTWLPSRRARRACCAALVVAAAVLLAAGHHLTRPRPSVVGAPPPELGAVALRVPVDAEIELAAWFAPGQPGCGGVLLLHGLENSRRTLLARALWLRARGHAVLLCDLRGHGESSASRISFGWHERADALAALRELRARCPGERLAAIGTSMGAAALLYAARELELDALVLESVYARIEDATADRLELHLGEPARALAPLLLLQVPWWIGASARELRPSAHASSLRVPTLVLVGADDRHAPPRAAREIAERAPAGVAALQTFPGVAHADLHASSPERYEREVGAFLTRHLALPR
ncbi:MAG: alpha/beta fold hydrolase [Planctomycetes bacterium]|nr:alpha/beta fold hydrolase [Planctomycetota bacterium]